jgi:NodT family efflux transporter outer membrane factor (OMF) lipoprotein
MLNTIRGLPAVTALCAGIGRRARLCAGLIGAGFLSACVLPPKETPHPAPLDERVGLTGVVIEPAPDGWWNSFQDPQLDQLIRAGLEDSPSLAQAQTRVADALARTEVARSGLLPQAKLGASVFYQRAPENFLIPAPLASHSFSEGQAGPTLRWDLDFWGKQADAVRRAGALTQAAGLDLDNARLMLSVAITQSYVELYRQNALAEIAERSAQQRQDIVNITRRRVAAGVDTQLELRQAEGQLPQALVARDQAHAAADLAVHQLAALSGRGADAYAAIHPPTLNIDAALPVPGTLPINLLARRPDVLSARFDIEAADAERLAQKAAFYPDISLSAFGGIGAFGLDNLVKWSARGYGAGPLISLPLFDGGRLRALYRSSESQLDAAVDGYNDTVLRAVQQTADQITRIDALARERDEQRQTLEANEAAYKLAEERYRAGLASYLAVLNAETQVLVARQTMVDIIAGQAIARITLLQAVGGSFDATRSPAGRPADPPAPSAQVLTRVFP